MLAQLWASALHRALPKVLQTHTGGTAVSQGQLWKQSSGPGAAGRSRPAPRLLTSFPARRAMSRFVWSHNPQKRGPLPRSPQCPGEAAVRRTSGLSAPEPLAVLQTGPAVLQPTAVALAVLGAVAEGSATPAGATPGRPGMPALHPVPAKDGVLLTVPLRLGHHQARAVLRLPYLMPRERQQRLAGAAPCPRRSSFSPSAPSFWCRSQEEHGCAPGPSAEQAAWGS